MRIKKAIATISATRGPPSSTPPQSLTKPPVAGSSAEAAEIPFTAFSAQKLSEQVPGRVENSGREVRQTSTPSTAHPAAIRIT